MPDPAEKRKAVPEHKDSQIKRQVSSKRSLRDKLDMRTSRARARFSVDEDDEDRHERPSLIDRMLDTTTHFTTEQGPAPTLKDYKPFSEMQNQKNKSLFLTNNSPSRQLLAMDESRENYLKRHSLSIEIPQKSIDQVLLLQHGNKVYRKISSDYVKTIGHIEQKKETSLRSLEYAKQRPAISVKDYQRMNQEYHAKLKEASKAMEKQDEIENKNALESDSTTQTSQFEAGLRLPGDSPLYQSQTEILRDTTTT